MDSTARYEDAAELRNWWATAPQLDENALRDGVISLLRKIHEASVYDDWAKMQDYIKLYELGETYCTEEPHLSLYEFGKMGICTYIADQNITRGDFAAALKKIEEVDQLFAARIERYSSHGKPARKILRIWAAQLLDLAEIKWFASEEWREAYVSPEQVLEQFRELVPQYVSHYQQSALLHERDIAFEALAITELAICKLATRYCPTQLKECVDGFNERHGVHLMLPVGHYKNVDAARGDHSAYYWDFELAKLRFSPAADLNDIYMLIEMRAMAAQQTFGDWPIQGLLRNWRREALMIVREVKLRSAEN